MASTRILRFPHGDEHSAHVLVSVSYTGPNPLDLKLTATEGEEPYTCVLKHSAASSLRVKNCPVSADEWERILLALIQTGSVEDIQVAAAVQSGTSISLTVWKQVQGITQRLGAILLECDQSEQIELFQWCDWSLGALEKHRKEAVDWTVRARELEAQVADLRAHLDELVQAKQDDEAALLVKFRDLLNEKKIKIREQQRIIAASSFKPDDSAVSPPHRADRHRPAPSRPSERKAATADAAEEAQDDGDQAMEDVTIKTEPDDTDPGNTSDDTASMSEAQDDDEPTPESGTNRSVEPNRSTPTSGNRGRQETPPKKTARAPPPRRNLPFANKQNAAPASTNEETESDDEL